MQGGNRVRDFSIPLFVPSVDVVYHFVTLQAGGQETVPFQAGADKRSRDFPADAEGCAGQYLRMYPLNLSRYEHPYSGKMREVVVQTFSGHVDCRRVAIWSSTT